MKITEFIKKTSLIYQAWIFVFFNVSAKNFGYVRRRNENVGCRSRALPRVRDDHMSAQ